MNRREFLLATAAGGAALALSATGLTVPRQALSIPERFGKLRDETVIALANTKNQIVGARIVETEPTKWCGVAGLRAKDGRIVFPPEMIVEDPGVMDRFIASVWLPYFGVRFEKAGHFPRQTYANGGSVVLDFEGGVFMTIS